jgi:hypothetical protein
MQLRPTILFIVANNDSMCEPVWETALGAAPHPPSIAECEILKFVVKMKSQIMFLQNVEC